MKKTIEIDKNDPTKIKVGDRLTLVGSGNTYTITAVDASDKILPVKVNVLENLRKEDADDMRALVMSVTEWWVAHDKIERITREVDSPELPTPTHNGTAYLGADGAIYVYSKREGEDHLPWFRVDPSRSGWFSSDRTADLFCDAFPLTELVPKYDAAPEPRHITDIREVRIGFIVFAKGYRTPFVCAFRDNAQRDVSSAFYKDSLICVSGKLPDELSAICGGSLNYCWLRNDMFDYAIAPIDSLGLGDGDEKC